MNIQLLINPSELIWSHTLLSGIAGAIIGGIISGGITYWAMVAIDKENKKRWEHDGFQRKKLELMLSSISLLADMQLYLKMTRSYMNTKKSSETETLFVEESERYKELYTNLSKLSVFYENYGIFEDITWELKKLIYLSKGIEIIFNNKTSDIYLKLYEKGIISYSYDKPYINYYQYLEYEKEQEVFIINNQAIMRGFKNAEEYSNSMQKLLEQMKELYDNLMKKIPQDKL